MQVESSYAVRSEYHIDNLNAAEEELLVEMINRVWASWRVHEVLDNIMTQHNLMEAALSELFLTPSEADRAITEATYNKIQQHVRWVCNRTLSDRHPCKLTDCVRTEQHVHLLYTPVATD